MKRLLLLLMIAAGATAEPRPIDAAEREAVVIATAFLAEGPRALWTRLGADAPLRALPESEALRELAVRTGPREGARWTLRSAKGSAGDVAFHVIFPSGYEDGLLFRMKRAGSGWQLNEVVTLAEPLERASAPRAPARPKASKPLLMTAIVLAFVAAFVRGRLKVIFVIAGLAVLGLALYKPAAKQTPTLPFTELRSLATLRAQLARGDAPRLPREVSGAARDVASLWMLQGGARAEMPRDNSTQLAELVRGRLALSSDKQQEAREAFERAIAKQPTRDDILLEAMKSIESFRVDPRVDGSRDAELYYVRAARYAADGKTAEGQRDLLTAWKLKPRPREELVRDPRLFALLHDVRIMAMVSLLSAQEPVVRSASFATAPVALPSNAKAFVCGEFLRLELDGATLDVHGGAALAPKEARVVPATFWGEQEDEAALRDAQALLELPSRGTTAAAQARVLRAANALAHHNRWADVVRVTDDVTPRTESAAPELLVLRFRALLRADRLDDARALATGQAVTRLMQGALPGTLITIADALTTAGAFDTALPLYESVESPQHEELIAGRIRQLELRRALSQNGITIATAHFDVRHDRRMNPAIAIRIGDLLEAELARLQAKLPVAEPRRVTANVLFWEDFRGDITGSDHILGLYDGEILFPFAVVQQFKPEVVSIITHELTHALVAQATGDNAPRWFQEGIAQRMELVPMHENAFNDNSPLLVLPVTLLDAVMENGIDPYATEQGYMVAQTFIRYLEARFGAKALTTLMSEFAKGRNTDDALKTLTGKSLDALNHDFRQWGFENNGHFRNADPWPYRDFYSPGVDPRIREGFSWGKKK